jgi:hypothetical protein
VDPPEILGEFSIISDNHWKTEIKRALKLRFPKILNSQESKSEFNLQKSVDMMYLIKRFQDLSGILLGSRVFKAVKNSELVLAPYDIKEMRTVYVIISPVCSCAILSSSFLLGYPPTLFLTLMFSRSKHMGIVEYATGVRLLFNGMGGTQFGME